MSMADEFDTDPQAAGAASDDWSLPGNRVRVTLEGKPPYVVRVTNRERVRWDMTYQRQGWPPATEAPFLAQTFMAWSASRRELLTELKFEQFRELVDDLEGLSEVKEDRAHPTQTGPGPGSS